MHRSGTSALTRMINLLGISLGRNLLLGHTKINAKGFWENKEVIDIHDRILGHLNSAWFDARPLPDQWWLNPELVPYEDRIVSILERDFKDQPIIALKDPRLCRLLPLWLGILKKRGVDAACILALRSPVEVAKSLVKRDGFDGGASSFMWLSYVLESEYHSRGLPRTIVCYDELLANWPEVAAKISRDLQIQWPQAIGVAEAAINQELLPELRHHKAVETDPYNCDDLCAKANEVYARLASNDMAHAREHFDTTRDWLAGQSPLTKILADSLYRTNHVLRERSKELAKIKKEHAAAQDYINSIRSHWMWKIARFFLKKPQA
jgi:hypothetical protein